jgi:hypothetical protein
MAHASGQQPFASSRVSDPHAPAYPAGGRYPPGWLDFYVKDGEKASSPPNVNDFWSREKAFLD